jgi:GntR family transcriptional regulator
MTVPVGVIDRSSSVPFHYQLRKLLEEQIETGQWSPGDRLPSEPSLSEHYGVSRPTVRQALHFLEQRGLIRREKGRGAFVQRSPSGSWHLQWIGGLFDHEPSYQGITVESTLIRASIEPLPEWATEALELCPEVHGVTLERLRRVDGDLAWYGVNHLPKEYAEILPVLSTSSTASLYETLREQCGVEVGGSSRVIEAVPAPRSVAGLLEVPYRYPLVYIKSVARNASGTPIDCYHAWVRTDRLRIVVETDAWASLAGRVVSAVGALN